jgi:hypothetical protein
MGHQAPAGSGKQFSRYGPDRNVPEPVPVLAVEVAVPAL